MTQWRIDANLKKVHIDDWRDKTLKKFSSNMNLRSLLILQSPIVLLELKVDAVTPIVTPLSPSPFSPSPGDRESWPVHSAHRTMYSSWLSSSSWNGCPVGHPQEDREADGHPLDDQAVDYYHQDD